MHAEGQKVNEQELRQIAYAIWEKEGCPHGRDMDHWLKAESALGKRELVSAPKPRTDSLPVKAKPAKKAATKTKTTSGKQAAVKDTATPKAPAARKVKAKA